MYSNRVYMGGGFTFSGAERYAYSKSSYYPNNTTNGVGTRPIMYIK